MLRATYTGTKPLPTGYSQFRPRNLAQDDGYAFVGEAATVSTFVPHPSTEPAAVHAAQLADVDKASRRRGWTIAGLVEELVLPEWNVRRCLHELGRLPAGEWHTPDRDNPRPKASVTQVHRRFRFAARWTDFRAAIRAAGTPLTADEIAARLGLSYPAAYHVLKIAAIKGLARCERRNGNPNGQRYTCHWSLTDG